MVISDVIPKVRNDIRSSPTSGMISGMTPSLMT